MVRDIAQQTGVTIEVLESPRTEEGKVDHVARAATLFNRPETRVVAIHVDPQDSRVIAALVYAFSDADDRLVLATAADLLPTA
jgi:hypothetical protein